MKLLKKNTKLTKKLFQNKHASIVMALVYGTMNTLKVNVMLAKKDYVITGLKVIPLTRTTFVNLPNLPVLQEALR